jgi:DNA-binding transcriptional ArsR family regulator
VIAKPKPITNIDDPRWIRAVSHPARVRVLAMLDEQTLSPVIIADKLGVPVSRVAYHVRVLHQLGLIELVRTRPRRGATEHYYKTTQRPTFTDQAWDALDLVSKQRVISANLEHAYQYALRAAAAGGFDEPDAHFTTSKLKLDAEGWKLVAEASKRWLEQVSQIEADALERLEADPHAAIDTALVIQFFRAVPFSEDQPSANSRPRQREVTRRAGTAGKP